MNIGDKESTPILFDFLISLLTRQNKSLRDITNFTYKAFCLEMDMNTLENVISIIKTPNGEASTSIICIITILHRQCADDRR